jgi:predicted small integral membrane protein
LLQSLTTVTKIGIITGVSVTGMLTIIGFIIGETETVKGGFLPWPTSWGDRFFVSLLVFFLISLLWLKFVEPFLPIYVALALGLIIGFIIIKWG